MPGCLRRYTVRIVVYVKLVVNTLVDSLGERMIGGGGDGN